MEVKMKTLTRIKLINWYYYNNLTLEIRDNILITGENGSGKSTLLDAIQYVLLGNMREIKFNAAASEDTKRSLEGYVRMQLQKNEYKRKGDVVCHLALEFLETTTNENTIIGACIQAPQGGNIRSNFYSLEGVSIDDNLFIEGGKPRDYRSFKTFVNKLDQKFTDFETGKEYRAKLSKFFSLDMVKYAKVLPKAYAFKPGKIDVFIPQVTIYHMKE
jgi:AAA15 family ATPase/GTPase